MRDPNNPWVAVPMVGIPGLILAWAIDWLMHWLSGIGPIEVLLMFGFVYVVAAIMACLGVLAMIFK